MSQEEFNYKSIHEYMDTLFKDKIPTDDEIKEAKQAYRKLYLKQYRKIYNKEHIQVSFRVSKSQYRKLQNLAKAMKVTAYVKQLVLNADHKNTTQLRQYLLELIDLVEAFEFENKTIDIQQLIKYLYHMQKDLS